MLIVLTGKTASGKDTVMTKLLLKYPKSERIISTTSRELRQGEKNGIDYKFISREEFEKKIKSGDFLEYVEYGGNLYGTEKSQIEKSKFLTVFWRIDPSMAGKVKDLIKNIKLLVIYLTVSDEVVLQRLKRRHLGDAEINKRLSDDKNMWSQYKNTYDFVVENIPGQLENTVAGIAKIIDNS